MISISKSKFLVLGIAMIAVLLIPANDAFADHSEVAITTVDESGFSQACAASQGGSGCYTPSVATVDVGGVVTMTNTDPTGVHTFTSGTVDGFAPNPNGVFDSGVLMSGDSFAWTPQTDIDQPYYCMLHTWMVGTIVVGDVDVAEPIPELTDEEFNVIANLNDQSSWLSGRFPKFDIHKADNEKYQVGGSPTLIINGAQAQAGRDSVSLLNAICAAFETAPEECNTQFEAGQPTPGFGWSTSTSANNAAAGCGV